MNMKVLKRTRRRPKEGDLFVYQIVDHDYGFGRVIDTSGGGGPESILIYFFNAFSPEKNRIPELSNKRLLIPPIFSMPWPWQSGHFETVLSEPLDPQSVLPEHCFEQRRFRLIRYVDEHGCELPRRLEPCGKWGIASTGYIDIVLSEALGLPPHPDTLFTDADFQKKHPNKQKRR